MTKFILKIILLKIFTVVINELSEEISSMELPSKPSCNTYDLNVLNQHKRLLQRIITSTENYDAN